VKEFDIVGAEVTTTVRGIPVDVPLGRQEGMQTPCVANCDHLFAVPRQALTEKISSLPANRIPEVKRAVGYAFGWEELINTGSDDRLSR
jgi:mRNA-degrading endonuclease toxin of MazEF toxin-antitoxin module